MTDLLADQVTQGVANALRARDLIAAVDLLKALAVLDPHRAQAIYDVLQIGIQAGLRDGIPEATWLRDLLTDTQHAAQDRT